MPAPSCPGAGPGPLLTAGLPSAVCFWARNAEPLEAAIGGYQRLSYRRHHVQMAQGPRLCSSRERLLAFSPAGSPHYKQEMILTDRSAGDKCFAEPTCGLQPTERLPFLFKNVCLAVIKRRCHRGRPGPRTLLLLHASSRPQGGGPGRGSLPPKIPTTNQPFKPVLEEIVSDSARCPSLPADLLSASFFFALFTTETLKDKSGLPADRGLLPPPPCSRSFHAITLFPLCLS